MKLYLDDRRTPPRDEGYIAADNYADFLETVDLDYDLGWDSLFNGYHALTYMKKHGICPQHINIHSTHISGRDKMLRYAVTNFPDSLVTGWASDY